MSDHKRPRVLVLAHMPPPIHGVTVVNEAMVNSRILRQRFELDVVPMRFARRFSDIGSLRLAKFAVMAWIALKLAYRLAFHRPDVVYMSLTPTGMSFVRDAIFVSIMNVFAVRKVFHLHGKGIRLALERSVFCRILYRWVFWRAHVIHLSERLRDDITCLAPPERIHIVANGIMPPSDPHVTREPTTTLPTILYLSNITKLKGIFVLLDALEILCSEGAGFRACFAGAPSDRETMRAFEQACAKSPLKDRVQYVGVVTGGMKERHFRAADIFVMPTLFDAFPLVALEAMAYALPVVCSAEGSLPDIVSGGETGILVPKGDAPALARALGSLLVNAAARQCMGEAGRRRYEAKFTLERMEENIAAVLERCIAA